MMNDPVKPAANCMAYALARGVELPMWYAIFHLACAAILLELAARAPVMDDI